ncbi:MAG: hypothetical protein ABIA11_03205 [Patescibacteria group bacterium]|nr:hypothetical protein [Patescibacteria group bacterium]
MIEEYVELLAEVKIFDGRTGFQTIESHAKFQKNLITNGTEVANSVVPLLKNKGDEELVLINPVVEIGLCERRGNAPITQIGRFLIKTGVEYEIKISSPTELCALISSATEFLQSLHELNAKVKIP